MKPEDTSDLIEIDEPEVAPQKTNGGSTSKYFKSEMDSTETVTNSPSKHSKKEETPENRMNHKELDTPKSSAKSPKGAAHGKRRTPKKTYVNLDSDMEDSEEEFKPNGDDDEEDEDEDLADAMDVEVDDNVNDVDVVDVDDEAEAAAADDDDMVIEEVEPAPKPKKAPAKKSRKPTELPPAVTGVHADQIMDKIPDAELPDAPETDGKLNYFALKGKQQNVPPPTGDIDLPEAAPNCLGGLTIVFTGVLPSLDRGAVENLAKRYGAKVTKSILKKTSLVVIGEEAGPSKVKKIKELGIKAINEDGFIELLRLMPADGGDSEQARLAKIKREEEERNVLEQAAAEEAAEEKRIQKEKAERAKREKELAQKKSQGDKSAAPAPPVKREISNDEKLWTSKYAPTSATQLCGNKLLVEKLRVWLANWFDYSKNNFNGSGPDGSKFRAALISGPPGIGKTTAAHLIANELGYDVLEKNASDVRSKSLLNSEIKSVLNNTSVVGFFKHKDDSAPGENDRKFCLIMDEVDGMSSGDHGGAGALSAFCRITKMPMILICNDRSLPKMRTFDTVTYGLPFRRPTELEMRSRLLTIAHREKLKLEPSVIGQLVQATGNDIRQIINLMSTVSKTQKVIGHENTKAIAESWKKHVVLKPFEITSTLLGGPIFSPSSKSTMNDKLDLYFNDIDFAPLMIQENYLMTLPQVLSKSEHLKRIAKAADCISQSDSINSLIRSSEQQWSLLPFHGVMSTVAPAAQVNGRITSRINFSSWLGNNSKSMKNQRLLQEVQYHTRLRTSTSKSELRLDYVPAMREAFTRPLIEEGEEGIAPVIEYMDHYYLSKDDWDSILGFGVGAAEEKALLSKINTKVKSAMTRKYNSTLHPVAIYKTGNSVGSATGAKRKVDFEDVVEDDTAKDEEVEPEDDGSIDAKKDKLIKKVDSKKGARGTKKATKGATKGTKRAKK